MIDDAGAERIRDAITEAVSGGIRANNPEGDPLVAVAATRLGADHAHLLLRQSVQAARHAGASWAAIGEELEITRQAAQQRFSTPEEPRVGRRQKLLKPVTAFDEMAELTAAGKEGWHSVRFGLLYHLLEASDEQWEHRREAFPLPGTRRRLEARGWVHIGTTYPWQYLKRPLGLPPVAPTA